jgi:hypothetical protein
MILFGIFVPRLYLSAHNQSIDFLRTSSKDHDETGSLRKNPVIGNQRGSQAKLNNQKTNPNG